MKIGVFSSPGGHLTEIMRLIEAFDGDELFFVLHTGPRHVQGYTEYQIKVSPWTLRVIIGLTWRSWRILRKERPEALISTGAQICIPAFWLAKFMGIRTIFIEDLCRIDQPTRTGRAVYPVVDRFLVQHPELLAHYGPKARYEGGVL